MKALRSGLVLACALLILVPAASRAADDGVEIIADVIYGHKAGMALTFDVFRPGNPNGAGVLFMVSGGWVSRWGPPQRALARHRALLDKGFTVFAIRHGSSPRFKVPEAVTDVRRAVRFIRLHAEEWGVDADRLGVYGGSAGGHLSLMLGTASDEGKSDARDPVERVSNRVAAVVAYFPPVDIRGIVGPNDRFPALEFDSALAEGISPIVFVSDDDPPTLLVHGDADTLVPLSNSERIHAAFDEAGVENKLIVIEGAGHGFRGEAAAQATEALAAWFEKHLNGK